LPRHSEGDEIKEDAVTVADVWKRIPRRRSSQPAATRVRVKGSFQPNALFGRVGEPVRIVFRREETSAGSERVVFPAFGRSATLPVFEDVTVELFPEEPGDYEFTCQLGLLKGRLHIFPAGSNDHERSTR
jgi:plastocyanin domain-containing protein